MTSFLGVSYSRIRKDVKQRKVQWIKTEECEKQTSGTCYFLVNCLVLLIMCVFMVLQACITTQYNRSVSVLFLIYEVN